MTIEQVLKNIARERGMSALRNGEALVGLFQDFSRNQLGPQANALRVFVSCQGNTRILNLQNAPLQERQVQLHRLVQEMTTQHNMREETAAEVCNAFWRAVYQKDPPVIWASPKPEPLKPIPPTPEPPKPAPPKPEPPKPEPPKPTAHRPMIHNRFYITKQEAQKGGPIRVYLPEGGCEVHTLPPNVYEWQYIPPISPNMKIGTGWDGKDDILRASDGRLAEAEKLNDPFSRHSLEGLLVVIMISAALYCLIPAGQLLLIGLDWLLNCIGLDILNSSDAVSLMLPYCTLVFHSLRDVTVELGWPTTLRQWFDLASYSAMPAFALGCYIVLSAEEWKLWLEVRQELLRRSKL